MANLLTAALTIEGTRPLLFHAFTPDAIPLSGKRERSGVAGNDPEEWHRTVLASADRRLYLDVRSVKNPATKARNVRYRIAAAPGWALTVAITWDKTVVSRGEMEAVTTDAGRLVGVGASPRRKITFARRINL